MQNIKSSTSKNNAGGLGGLLTAALWLGFGLTVFAAGMAGSLLLQTPVGSTLLGFIKGLFAADSVQLTWYITRSAGLTAYLVLWLSVAWGLAVSSKIFDTLLHRSFTYDFHQFLSLLALGFTAIHLGSLLFDRYLPYSIGQLLVPGLSAYRPLWVAFGIVALYLLLLVTVTFYLRGRIGMKAFRTIHVFSLVAFLGTAIHGLLAGTDSSLPAVLLLYAATFLSVVFLLSYWLVTLGQKKRAKRVLNDA